MTRPSLAPTLPRIFRSTLASALCGSLLLNALPAFAQSPAPVPGAAPSPSGPPPAAGAQAPAGAPQPMPSAVSPVDAPAPAALPPATPEGPPTPMAAPAPAAPATEAAPPPMPPLAPPAVPPPPTEPPPEAPPPENSKLSSYLMWGVGGASLIVGTVFGIAAIAGESKYNDNPTFSKADSVHTRALASDIGLGLGVVLIASGTVFYFVHDAPPSAEHAQRAPRLLARLGVSPIVSLKTQGAAVTLKF